MNTGWVFFVWLSVGAVMAINLSADYQAECGRKYSPTELLIVSVVMPPMFVAGAALMIFDDLPELRAGECPAAEGTVS